MMVQVGSLTLDTRLDLPPSENCYQRLYIFHYVQVIDINLIMVFESRRGLSFFYSVGGRGNARATQAHIALVMFGMQAFDCFIFLVKLKYNFFDQVNGGETCPSF